LTRRSQGGMIVIDKPDRPVPLKQMTFFTFEPPVFFLHQARGLVVEYDILEKALDLRYQEREIRYARRLDEIAFEASVAVGGELF